MNVGIKKLDNGYIEVFRTAYTDGRFSEETISNPPYNYKKVFVPDECVDSIISEDFDDDLSFNRDKYDARINSIAAEQEIWELKEWFGNVYTFKEQKFRRLRTLKILDDDGRSGEEKLLELYQEAETKRRRIQELEQKVVKKTTFSYEELEPEVQQTIRKATGGES